MADDVLADSLKTLSQLLAKYYGRKVVILIDEYDVPLDKAFQGGYYDEIGIPDPQFVWQCAENK